MTPEEYKYQTSKNVQQLDEQIRNLNSKCNEFDFKAKPFWEYVKIVNSSFKTLKPIPKNEREQLWSRFQNLCQKAKSLQANLNDNFKHKSSIKRNDIFYFIKEAKLWGKDNYSKSQDLMGKAMYLMKNSKLTKEDREKCWEEWKRIKDTLSSFKSEDRKNNYIIIKDKIIQMSNTAAYGNPKNAMKEIKQIQSMLKNYPMEDAYWKEVQSSLQRYWNMAQSRLDEYYREKKRDWEAKNAEYQEKKKNWVRNQEAALYKFNNIISKNENFIDRLRDQIDSLQNQMYGSSESYRNRASGWISEKQEKILDVQNSNRDLESKIQDIRRQLNK